MLNWLVIGIGDITTKRGIPAIQAEPRSHLYGILTRDPAKAAPYGAKVWTTLDEALTDSAVDAVYVATPVSLHAPQTIASLRAGRHVLCEKPVALDYAEAQQMVDVATQMGRTLGIAYYRRMYPKIQRAKALIEQGAIGQPVVAELTNHYWYDETGHGPWRLDPKLAGGGPLYDIASHRIDVLNFLFGRPVKASAHLANTVHRYGECRIIGTDGELNLTPLNGPELRHPRGEEHLPVHPNLHYPCVENFVTAVLEGGYLYATGESSIWTDWVTSEALKN
jgi:1,5-anhydro-D-fructose reductase (1,5-anhydro-D-mannitol-forming)